MRWYSWQIQHEVDKLCKLIHHLWLHGLLTPDLQPGRLQPRNNLNVYKLLNHQLCETVFDKNHVLLRSSWRGLDCRHGFRQRYYDEGQLRTLQQHAHFHWPNCWLREIRKRLRHRSFKIFQCWNLSRNLCFVALVRPGWRNWLTMNEVQCQTQLQNETETVAAHHRKT